MHLTKSYITLELLLMIHLAKHRTVLLCVIYTVHIISIWCLMSFIRPCISVDWVEQFAFWPLYVMITFHTRIFHRGVPGFATDCLCRVWSRGLTTCLLYVGPHFGNLALNDSGFVSLTWWKPTFLLFHLYLKTSLYDDTLFSWTLFSCLK